MTGVPSPASFARSVADRAAASAPAVDVAVGGGGEVSVPAVDEVLAGLERLDGMPCGERVAVFEDVHERLQDILATVDDA